MEGGNEHPPKVAPKSGLGKVVSGVDKLLFGPSAESGPTRPDAVISPPASKAEALNVLREKLVGDVTRLRGFIEEARADDNKPRSRLKNVFHKLGNFGQSQEDHEKAQWEPEIDKRMKIIHAINQGNEQVAIEYLVGEVEMAIKMAKRGVLITGDRESEHGWIDGAQQDIDILMKIDPEQGEKLQKELDRKTGNPLNKF